MNISYQWFDSATKHIIGKEEQLPEELVHLHVVREEAFAVQLLLHTDTAVFCRLNNARDIDWKGLTPRIRLALGSTEIPMSIQFLGYVTTDEGQQVGDPILKRESTVMAQPYQMMWVEGKIPADFPHDQLTLRVNCYYTDQYDVEQELFTAEIPVSISSYVLPSVKESDFHLNLWQHPCSWARAYDIPYFSDLHFEVIDHYLASLSEMGQRVIGLVVTDYPWAGQRCYDVQDNASNLFEHNIVRVLRNGSSIQCDFTAMDRYVECCEKHGIDREIHLFGLIGNWDARLFGSPISEIKDPIRIACYDLLTDRADYVRTPEEFHDYLSCLFEHLVQKGWWDKVRIMSDEPNDISLFQEMVQKIESAAPQGKILLTCALHDQSFFQSYGEQIQNLSLNTCELLNNMPSLEKLNDNLHKKSGTLTWFSCCFPESLNIFLSSPLLESRLKGWYTFYWHMDGFLRWAYAIWPADPWREVSYKYPKWRAGDMFFVYPGKDMRPVASVRSKNLLYGIQDWTILQAISKRGGDVHLALIPLLGEKEKMSYVPPRGVSLHYSTQMDDYLSLRNKLIEQYLE